MPKMEFGAGASCIACKECYSAYRTRTPRLHELVLRLHRIFWFCLNM